MSNCLAIDINAVNGRVVRGVFDKNKMSLEMVHEFETGIEKSQDRYRWDVDKLFSAICEGLKKSTTKGVHSIGIDTWGVDFVLLDENGDKLEQPVSYRDDRTKGMMEKYFAIMPRKDLYAKTGIQCLEFNTLFQFMALIKEKSPLLDKAKSFLMIPDFLAYQLTGKQYNEFSNVSTTQMMNAFDKKWDKDIISALGVNGKILKKIVKPGDKIGLLTSDLAKQTGLPKVPVHAVASHDTASAVAATPAYGKNWVYICSGNWSLMGIESDSPITCDKAFEYNLTNEGGVNDTYRVLKNIMGQWMIRGIQKSLDQEYTLEELRDLAREAVGFKHIIFANDDRFINPDSMCLAIDEFCLETGQESPQSPGEYVRCAQESLIFLYRKVLGELRDVYDKPILRLHILGKGVEDKMLCQMAADATGLTVYAGPIEAAAIGNLIVQAMSLGIYDTLEDARQVVYDSFDIGIFSPIYMQSWNTAYKKFLKITKMVN